MSEASVHGLGIGGLGQVPLSINPLKRKDFTSDQEVRWCPGCGDYAILSAVQALLPELGIARAVGDPGLVENRGPGAPPASFPLSSS